MKSIINLLSGIAGIILAIWDLSEILAIPVLLVIIGLLNSFSWQYYVISIAIYFAIMIIVQVVCHLVAKRFEKKFESALDRLFQKLFG